jgi:hypothetical protein
MFKYILAASAVVAGGTYFALRSKEDRQNDRENIIGRARNAWNGAKDYVNKLFHTDKSETEIKNAGFAA